MYLRPTVGGNPSIAERLITKAKHLGPIAYTLQDKLSIADEARRQAAQAQVGRFLRRFAVLHTGDESRTIDLIEKVFVGLAKRFQSRPGGYTRIIKVGRRRGDNAPMVIIELLQESDAKAEAVTPAAEPERAEAPKAEQPKAEEAKAAAEPEKAEAPKAEEPPSAEAAPAAEAEPDAEPKQKAEG